MRSGLAVVSLLVRLVAWLAALVFGSWIAAVAGWSGFIGARSLWWRVLGAGLAALFVMFIVDRLWRNRPVPGTRFYVSEIVDAVILGFFFGVAFTA
jgi:hypothetical protein